MSDAGHDEAALHEAVRALRSPATIRERCAAITAMVAAGRSEHFRLDRTAMPAVAARVTRLTRQRYPELKVPVHSRWRHFSVGGVDRAAELDARLGGHSAIAAARAMVDLTVVSVLLDAGAHIDTTAGPDALTPLMIASSQVSPGEGAIFLPGSTRPIDLARELIQMGADVNIQSKSGVTALMIAAARNVAPMIGLLIQAGAKADLKSAQGQTAADIAEQNLAGVNAHHPGFYLRQIQNIVYQREEVVAR